MFYKNYTLDEFIQLTSTPLKKIEKPSNHQYVTNSVPQTQLKSSMEVDMNHPNEVKVLQPQPQYQQPQQQYQQPQYQQYQQPQYQQYQQPQQQYQQYQQPIQYYPHPPPQYKEDMVEFKTKTGKVVKFKAKKEKKPKIVIEENIIKKNNEQANVEAVPQMHT